MGGEVPGMKTRVFYTMGPVLGSMAMEDATSDKPIHIPRLQGPTSFVDSVSYKERCDLTYRVAWFQILLGAGLHEATC